jgi:hypothetical protein
MGAGSTAWQADEKVCFSSEKCFSTFGRKERDSGRNTLARLFGAHTRCIPPMVEPFVAFFISLLKQASCQSVPVTTPRHNVLPQWHSVRYSGATVINASSSVNSSPGAMSRRAPSVRSSSIHRFESHSD